MLLAWGQGDESARERLLAVVYDELRRLALSHMQREQANHTLQPTALVNEAYLKLVGQEGVRWQGRAHFFGIAARLMREILVDHARRRMAEKRGGPERQRLSLTAPARRRHRGSIRWRSTSSRRADPARPEQRASSSCASSAV